MKNKLAETTSTQSKKPKVESFVRSFAHVDGNWPSHVYLTGNYTKLNAIANLCVNHVISRSKYSALNFVPIDLPHLSLSKPFVLRHHQIESFIRQLGQSLTIINRFSVQIFSEYQLLLNESNTRLFVTLPIEDRDLKLQRLIQSVDSVLKLFSQPVYYEKPLHHISIASCLVGNTSRHSQRVVQVSESFKLSRSFFPVFSEDSGSDDDNDHNYEKTRKEEDFEDIQSSCVGNCLTDNPGDGDSDSESPVPEVDDCLGVVLEFSGIECRIGNRLFRCPFPTSSGGGNNSSSSSNSLTFKEIK